MAHTSSHGDSAPGDGHGHADGHGHGEPWKWLGDGSLRGEDADEGLGHIVPLEIFNRVMIALFVLTFITVAVSRVDFGEMNTVIAIGIASVKAFVVAMFFMHLKFEKKIILLYAIYPLILLFLLIGGSLMDVAEREHPLPYWMAELNRNEKPAPVLHNEQEESASSAGEAPAHH